MSYGLNSNILQCSHFSAIYNMSQSGNCQAGIYTTSYVHMATMSLLYSGQRQAFDALLVHSPASGVGPHSESRSQWMLVIVVASYSESRSQWMLVIVVASYSECHGHSGCLL